MTIRRAAVRCGVAGVARFSWQARPPRREKRAASIPPRCNAAGRIVADLFGRLYRPPLQRAHAGQPARPSRTLTLAWVSRVATGPGAAGRTSCRCAACHRRRAWSDDAGVIGARDDQRINPSSRRRAVRDRARSRLGAGRARRPRVVAVLLENARRDAHRQPRRGDLEQLPVLRNARQLSRLARRANRQGALERRDRRLRRAVLLHAGADHRRQPRAGRHRQRSRHARLPAVVRRGDRASWNGSSTPCR